METKTERTPFAAQAVEDLWDTKRLARFLGCSYDRAMRLVHELNLPYSQWGGKTSPMRFRPDAVRQWVIENELPHVGDSQN
jgi:hypothetical protein